MKKHYLFTILLGMLFILNSNGQTTITQWNFDGETLAPNIGAGTADNVGGTSTAYFGGVTGQAWSTAAYPAQETNSGEAGVQFALSTVGFANIQLDYQHRASATGSRYAEVQYSTDGGAAWSTLGSNNGGISPHNNFYSFNFDFSACTACNDNADFVVRIVSVFSPCEFVQNSTLSYNADQAYMRSDINAQCTPHTTTNAGNYGQGGTWRFDDVTFSGNTLQAFYSKATGDLNDLGTWGDQTDGTGTAPANFTDDSQVFYIHNNLNPTISDNWEVSGLGSNVILGDGTDNITFTVPTTNFFTGNIDIEDNAVLVLQNTVTPTLGDLEEGSTVVYSENAVGIMYHAYHHLVIDDIDPVFTGDNQLSVAGDFTLSGTVNMPDARDIDEYDILFNGSGNQTITGNGNVVRAYNAVISKTNGIISLATNTTFSTDNQIQFFIESPAVFQDNGNSIHAGNSVNMGGDQAAYELTGTLILNDFETGIVKGSGDGNNFNIREGANTNIVAELNNLVVRAVNQGGQFRFRAGTSNSVVVKGDFVVEEQVAGNLRFYANTLEVKGDFMIEENFLGGFTNTLEHLVFNGTTNQNFSNGFADLEISELTVNNGNEVILNDPLFIDDIINFTNGLIVSTQANGLYLLDGSGVNGGNADSYVDGPFFVELDTDVATSLTYPIGKAGAYRPATLNVNQSDATSTWYHVEVMDGAPATFTLGAGLDAVSSVRYFEVGQTTAVDIDALVLTLNYDTDDNVTTPNDLRIAHEVNGEWINLGGAGSGAPSGSITTSNAFTTLGLFILADAEAGSQNDPEIIANPVSLTGFNQVLGSPSAEQSFSVQGLFLNDDITITAPANFEISITSGAGFTNEIILTQTSGNIALTDIYVRLNALSVGNSSGDILLTSTGAANVEVALSGETIEITQPGDDLIYYWHFNNMDPDGDDVTAIEADYSLIPGFMPFMTYTGSSNRDMDVYDPGSMINAQMGETEGFAARVRNESDGRTLLFNFNTEGVERMIFEYAIHRSGSGMLENIIDYSTDGGITFTQDFLSQTDFTITESYELVSVDFTGVTAAENNTDFIIRISFQGNTQQTNGNNRYDNITLKGDASNVGIYQNEMFAKGIKLYPNPVSELLNISSEQSFESIQILDLTGKVVYESRRIDTDFHTLNAANLNAGTYVVRVVGKANIANLKFVKQ